MVGHSRLDQRWCSNGFRDVESDEDANAAKILKSAVAGVANTVMVPFEATAQAFKKKKVEEIDEELPTEDTVEE